MAAPNIKENARKESEDPDWNQNRGDSLVAT